MEQDFVDAGEIEDWSAVGCAASERLRVTLVRTGTPGWRADRQLARNERADPMTDKKECTAYYGSGRTIQLTRTSFAISYRGRGMLKAYTIRFGDEPALPTALPGRTEEEIGALLIDANEPRWAKLSASKRVRVQAFTVLSTIVNDDVDLTRLADVMARLSGPGCS